MSTRANTSANPLPQRAADRIGQLSAELVYAWDRSDASLVKAWASQSARIFGKSFVNRANNLVGLVQRAATASVTELVEASAAYRADALLGHVTRRGNAAYEGTVDLAARAIQMKDQLQVALTNTPREAVPQLLTTVITSLLVSGGPDGDGGAPDLDIVVGGIGTHRSLFTHSIFMGAAIEAGFLSLVNLVSLVHENLPREHDPLWDTLAAHAGSIAQAASAGASIGMSYHLLVDGLVQPGTYHGLPVSVPLEAHQAVFVVNGVAEAAQVVRTPNAERHHGSRGKTEVGDGMSPHPAARSATLGVPLLLKDDKALSREDQEAWHRMYLRGTFYVPDFVAHQFSEDDLAILTKFGAWLEALSCGDLTPISAAQEQFVEVAKGHREPQTAHEVAWNKYWRIVLKAR